MEKLILERQNNKTYLVGRVPEGFAVDEDCLATVSEEKTGEEQEGFAGVVPVIYSQVFQDRTLKYDVNAYLPLAEYKPRITGRQQLATLFLSIIDTYQKAESYLLDTGFFLLDEAYVYVNEATGKASLILYPVAGMASETDLRQLFCRMMNGIRLAEKDMGFYGKVIYELDYAESFNIVKFKELLSSRDPEDNKASVPWNRNAESDGLRNKSLARSGPAELDTPEHPAVFGQPEHPAVFGQPDSPAVPGQPDRGNPGAGEREDFPDLQGERGQKTSRAFGGLFGGAGRKNKPSGDKADREKPVRKKKGREKPARGKASGSSDLFAPPDQEVGVSKRAPKGKTAPPDPGRDENILHDIPRTADEDIFEAYASTMDEEDETGKRILELFYRNEKRVIRVTVFPFEIGREGSGCRIDPSKGKVSRRHAVLQRDGERFQICDVSKLGTLLNGEKLPRDVFVDLADGMRIDMKGEVFEVRITGG